MSIPFLVILCNYKKDFLTETRNEILVVLDESSDNDWDDNFATSMNNLWYFEV